MTQQVIGMLGVKGAGKDTAALVLVKDFAFQQISFATGIYQEVSQAFGVAVAELEIRELKESPQERFALVNCANPDFKRVALLELGFSSSQVEKVLASDAMRPLSLKLSQEIREALNAPRSPRWILQQWGSEFRRQSEFGYDAYWRDQIAQTLQRNPHINYVISDVRFKNEVVLLANLGGTLVRVRRPELEALEELNRQSNGTAAHASETELLNYEADFEVINEEGNPLALAEQLKRLVSSGFKAAA